MPIFEYRCQQCGNEFEKLVFNRSAAVECPSCDGAQVTKKFSTFGMKSGGSFVPSTGGGGCASCSSHSCSTCGGH
jgi:putative FmdB family regulatory protein